MADFWRNFLDSLYKGLPKSAELAKFLIGLVEVVVIVGVSLLLARLVKHWASQLLGRARVSANVLAASWRVRAAASPRSGVAAMPADAPAPAAADGPDGRVVGGG